MQLGVQNFHFAVDCVFASSNRMLRLLGSITRTVGRSLENSHTKNSRL